MDDYISKPLRREDLHRVLGVFQPQTAASSAVSSARLHTSAELLERCEGDADLLAELIMLFGEQTPKLLDVIRRAIAANDAAALAAAAHKLLGSVAAFGAEKAREIVLQLSADAASSDFEEAADRVVKLAAELDQIHSALARYASPPARPLAHVAA
jgi:HPt (histidine-containing phosphotransfer) domain-containing protein